MPKIVTGGYLLRFYDRYGTPIKTCDVMVGSYTEGRELGDSLVSADTPSYTIDRRLYNSLDPVTTYNVKSEVK